MKTSLTIALVGATLVFGAAVSLKSGIAAAHHNASHSIAQCGSVVCPNPKTTQVPTTIVIGR